MFNPENLEMESILNPLYYKYKNVKNNFRNNLICFKKKISGNRQRFKFLALDAIKQTKYDKKIEQAQVNECCKIVIVGDGAVGKTSLIMKATTGLFDENVYNRCENYTFQYSNRSICLCDTAGQADYDILRPLWYPNTDLILICYSVDSPISFENVTSKWIIDMRHHLKDIPIILVGCKTDLRKKLDKPIDYESGYELARYLGCLSYLETSSVNGDGFKDFSEIVLNAIDIGRVITQESKKNKCTVQ